MSGATRVTGASSFKRTHLPEASELKLFARLLALPIRPATNVLVSQALHLPQRHHVHHVRDEGRVGDEFRWWAFESDGIALRFNVFGVARPPLPVFSVFVVRKHSHAAVVLLLMRACWHNRMQRLVSRHHACSIVVA